MTVYILRRLLQAVPLLIGVSLAGFVLLRLAPGGPMAVYAQNPSMSEADLRRIEKSLGLDQPIHVQYVKWASGMAAVPQPCLLVKTPKFFFHRNFPSTS